MSLTSQPNGHLHNQQQHNQYSKNLFKISLHHPNYASLEVKL